MSIKCVLCCIVVGIIIGAVSVMIGGAVSDNAPSSSFTFITQPIKITALVTDNIGVACRAVMETAGGEIKGFSCNNISKSTGVE